MAKKPKRLTRTILKDLGVFWQVVSRRLSTAVVLADIVCISSENEEGMARP